MRCPSTRRLVAAFRDLDTKGACLIRRLAYHVDDPGELRTIVDRQCPETATYVRNLPFDPYDSAMWRRTVVLHAIDKILGTYGVEPLGPVYAGGPPYEYCSTGETYDTTLIYTRATDTIRIGSWGDIAERHPEWP